MGLGGGFRGAGFRERVPDDRLEGPSLQGADEAFIELGHGRHLAGAQALDFLESDLLARGGLAGADLQALLHPLQDLSGAAQEAGQTGADPKLAPAHRLGVEHVVEGDRLPDVRACHAQGTSHPGLCLLGDVPQVLLDEPQERQHGCLRMLVTPEDPLGPAFEV